LTAKLPVVFVSAMATRAMNGGERGGKKYKKCVVAATKALKKCVVAATNLVAPLLLARLQGSRRRRA